MHIDTGWLDLLAIDGGGRLGVYEFKRGTLVREADFRIINYASDLDAMSILPRAIGWGGKAFGSTPDPWPGIQVAYDLWKARDRGGGIAVERFVLASYGHLAAEHRRHLKAGCCGRLETRHLSSGSRLPNPVVHLTTSLGTGLSIPPLPETPSNKNPCLCQ